MTTVHSLTNLAADHFLDLTVESGEDIMTAARRRLFDSGLPEAVQQGFFVSVYPIEASEPTEVQASEEDSDAAGMTDSTTSEEPSDLEDSDIQSAHA